MDITTFMFSFAVAGIVRPTVQTFTSNGSVTVPTAARTVNLSGYGARGKDEYRQTDYEYVKRTTKNGTRRSDGGQQTISSTTGSRKAGRAPADYCDPPVSTPYDSVYSSTQTCYTHTEYRDSYTVPAGIGVSATALGKSFPGSLGNVQQSVTTFTAVDVATAGGTAVTGGTQFNVVVPTGGSITISY